MKKVRVLALLLAALMLLSLAACAGEKDNAETKTAAGTKATEPKAEEVKVSNLTVSDVESGIKSALYLDELTLKTTQEGDKVKFSGVTTDTQWIFVVSGEANKENKVITASVAITGINGVTEMNNADKLRTVANTPLGQLTIGQWSYLECMMALEGVMDLCNKGSDAPAAQFSDTYDFFESGAEKTLNGWTLTGTLTEGTETGTCKFTMTYTG